MFNYDDNPILIDTNSKRQRKQKILCVLCKVQLDCTNPEENRYKCPRCRNTYQLGFNQINEFEDELESSHEEDDFEDSDSVGLLVADDDDEFDEDIEEDDSKSDIPIPKYMQNSATTELIDYREE
jgi:hypothetical protein